jgi:ABC-type nitrate/sulfonate/bicarbonate transport system substrate-binding protein
MKATGIARKKITVIAIAVIALMAATAFGMWYLTDSRTAFLGPSESIIIGTTPYESTALIYIADDLGYFSANGLNVQFRDYENGLEAVKDMKRGKVNISASAEYPIILAAFNKENISIIASIDKIQSAYLVCRKDRGIENLSDIKGKKIGVPRGTINEFVCV